MNSRVPSAATFDTLNGLSAFLNLIAVIAMLGGHFGGVDWLFWAGMILLTNVWLLFVLAYYWLRKPKTDPESPRHGDP